MQRGPQWGEILYSDFLFCFFDICDDIQLHWYLWWYSPSLISVMIFSFFDICHSILLACGTVRRLKTCWTGTPWWKSITQLWKVTLERIRRRVEAYIWGLLTRSLSWLCMKIMRRLIWSHSFLLDDLTMVSWSKRRVFFKISFIPFRWFLGLLRSGSLNDVLTPRVYVDH